MRAASTEPYFETASSASEASTMPREGKDPETPLLSAAPAIGTSSPTPSEEQAVQHSCVVTHFGIPTLPTTRSRRE